MDRSGRGISWRTQRACLKQALDHSRWSICGRTGRCPQGRSCTSSSRGTCSSFAQSLSADARAGLAAFLDKNPEASIAEVARHMRAEHGLVCHRTTVWRAMKQHFTPFKKVPCQKISAANTEKRKNFALRTSLELRAFTGRTRISTRVTPLVRR